MIARLSGTVVALEEGALILDVAGVGYRVHVPSGVLADHGRLGEAATLLIHLHLRENPDGTLRGGGRAYPGDLQTAAVRQRHRPQNWPWPLSALTWTAYAGPS